MPNYKHLFMQLFADVAECEMPEGSRVDDVLGDHQEAYDAAGGR